MILLKISFGDEAILIFETDDKILWLLTSEYDIIIPGPTTAPREPTRTVVADRVLG